MQRIPALYSVIGLAAALAALPAEAQDADLLEQLKIMRQQLEEQRARVDQLEAQVRAAGLAPAAHATGAAAGAERLAGLRGTGNLPAPQDQGNVAAAASFIESHLGTHAWFSGQDLTIADFQMSFAMEALLARFDADAPLPRLRAWVDAMRARPAYQRALEQGGPVMMGA